MLKNAVLYALSANEKLASDIAKKLDVKLGERLLRRFPSGEILVEPLDSVRGKTVFIIQSTCPPVNDNLMEVLIFVDALKRSSAKEINLIVPYFGYARQDRKAKSRQPITAALVAHLLATAGVDRVVTVNLHAAQSQGFFSCLVDDISAVNLLGKYILKQKKDLSNAVVVSPDHGGVDRARSLAELFSSPLAIIDKRRKNNLDPEALSVIGEVEGKDCYMIDDMVDTGKSAVIGEEALLSKGAKSVSLLAVHPVCSDPCYSLLKDAKFKEILVTDSIPLSDKMASLPNVKVISLAAILAKCIDDIDNDIPLTGIYRDLD